MKKWFGICLSFLIINLLLAHAAHAQSDKKAKDIMKSMAEKMGKLESMSADIVITLQSGAGKTNQKQNAHFKTKGSNYSVELRDQIIISNSQLIWTYSKSANEVQIMDYDPNEQSFSPASLFSNFPEKDYEFKYMGQQTENGRNCDKILLTPVNKSKSPFSKLEILVDQSYTVRGGRMIEKNGNTLRYEISRFIENPSLSNNNFVFDPEKYPGVEIVDLR